MAVIAPVVTPVYGHHNIDGWQVIWGPMQSGDVGAAVGTTIGQGATAQAAPGAGTMAGFADKTIQAAGTFSGGSAVIAEGSNDAGANWFQLSDPQGNLISITALAMKEITEAVIWVRPRVAGGDVSTSLIVTMFLRKTQTP